MIMTNACLALNRVLSLPTVHTKHTARLVSAARTGIITCQCRLFVELGHANMNQSVLHLSEQFCDVPRYFK